MIYSLPVFGAADLSRSAWSAWSLLPLCRAPGRPKAPPTGRETHSKRFAQFGSVILGAS